MYRSGGEDKIRLWTSAGLHCCRGYCRFFLPGQRVGVEEGPVCIFRGECTLHMCWHDLVRNVLVGYIAPPSGRHSVKRDAIHRTDRPPNAPSRLRTSPPPPIAVSNPLYFPPNQTPPPPHCSRGNAKLVRSSTRTPRFAWPARYATPPALAPSLMLSV